MVLGAKYDSQGAHLRRNNVILLDGEKRRNRHCGYGYISGFGFTPILRNEIREEEEESKLYL